MNLQPINSPNTHHHGGYRLKDMLSLFDDPEKAKREFLDQGSLKIEDKESPGTMLIFTMRCKCEVMDVEKQ